MTTEKKMFSLTPVGKSGPQLTVPQCPSLSPQTHNCTHAHTLGSTQSKGIQADSWWELNQSHHLSSHHLPSRPNALPDSWFVLYLQLIYPPMYLPAAFYIQESCKYSAQKTWTHTNRERKIIIQTKTTFNHFAATFSSICRTRVPWRFSLRVKGICTSLYTTWTQLHQLCLFVCFALS